MKSKIHVQNNTICISAYPNTHAVGAISWILDTCMWLSGRYFHSWLNYRWRQWHLWQLSPVNNTNWSGKVSVETYVTEIISLILDTSTNVQIEMLVHGFITQTVIVINTISFIFESSIHPTHVLTFRISTIEIR